jgi:hypothetical protein
VQLELKKKYMIKQKAQLPYIKDLRQILRELSFKAQHFYRYHNKKGVFVHQVI